MLLGVIAAATRQARTLPPRVLPPLLSASTVAGETSGGRGRRRLSLPDAEATLLLGARLAEVCRAGDVVLLRGDYGAGKTCLARGFVRCWYNDPSELVTSPSYLIDNVYDDPDGIALQPRVAVHHMDLWRLPEGKIQELVNLEMVFTQCVSLIEWPDKLGAELMPHEYLEINLAILDEAEAEAEQAAAAAVASDDENEDGYLEDDAEEKELLQPRVATLTAYGDQWEERLAAICGEADS